MTVMDEIALLNRKKHYSIDKQKRTQISVEWTNKDKTNGTDYYV